MQDPTPITDKLTAAAQQYGLDPGLFQRQAYQESGYNQNAVSGAGALGVMQLMPGTANDLGVDPSNLDQNIDGGARYMRQMLNRYGGNQQLALAAYNGGPGKVDAYLKGGSLKPETLNYVKSITGSPLGQATANANGQSQVADDSDNSGSPGVLSALSNLGSGALNAANGGQANWSLGSGLMAAGAGLTSINNPSGGASMMQAAMAPMFKQRYSVVKDAWGNQRVFDLHRGQFVGAGAGGAGGGGMPMGGGGGVPAAGGGGAAPGGAGGAAAVPPGFTSGAPDQQESDANTMLGRTEQAKLLQEQSSKEMDGYNDSAAAAQALIPQLEKAKRLSQDPNVTQGGEFVSGLSNAVKANLAGAGINLPGASQSAELEKLNSQIQGQYLTTLKGMTRLAGPELKFGEMANAGLDKPRETNQQIYDNMIQQMQRVIGTQQLANKHYSTYGILGSHFHSDLLGDKFQQAYPLQTDTTVQPSSPSASPNGLPSGVNSIKVLPAQ